MFGASKDLAPLAKIQESPVARSEVHFINVKPGDCTVIRHASGRVSVVDICDGNLETRQDVVEQGRSMSHLYALGMRMPPPQATVLTNTLGALGSLGRPPTVLTNTLGNLGLLVPRANSSGNHRMCERPSNPLNYLRTIGITQVFRFVLTHPEMDHMDGLSKLLERFHVLNFWDTGYRRAKPDSFSFYNEEDWDAYEAATSGTGVLKAVTRLANESFAFANKENESGSGQDGLSILAPSAEMVDEAERSGDANEASYVIAYGSAGGKILLSGDAHDASWDHVIAENRTAISNCAVLLAPHHGRDSGRSYDFLDVAQPKLTVIGCAPSEHIDYSQWNRRGLRYLTSNQAGNIVLEIDPGVISVFVENEEYAVQQGCDRNVRNVQGFTKLMSIAKPS